MKILQLLAMHLVNFKRIRDQKIEFDQRSTTFLGHNGTGKTTLLDAFLWCLFGKDSTGRKDFEIKTLDENNQPYHNLEHSVETFLNVDGLPVTIRRVYSEKYTTKRGEKKPVFAGHQTEFYWNDVPLKESEFQAKVNDLVREDLFRLLTNATFFNSLKWQDRRAVLMAIAGEITESDVAEGNQSFSDLLDSIRGRKTMEEYKKEIAASKKRVREQLDVLPTRIQEANRAVPDAVDYESIEASINQASNDLSSVESLLSSKSAAAKDHEATVVSLTQKRTSLSRELVERTSEIKNQFSDKKMDRELKIRETENQLASINEELSRTRRDYKSAADRKLLIMDQQISLRQEWEKVNAETLQFAAGQFCCPTCKRDYEASDVEAKKQELTGNFNRDKSHRLTTIAERGKILGEELTDLEVKLGNLTAQGSDIKGNLEAINQRKEQLVIEHNRLCQQESEDLNSALQSDPRATELRTEIAGLTEQIDQPFASDNTDLKNRKVTLQLQLDQLKKQLASRDQRDKQLARVNELTGQEEILSQELADLEGKEFTILQFEKAKMNLVEQRVNGKFKIARFKMFETQINGGEEPTCVTLIGGVPYADANNAAKIQVGIDIINVLSTFYQVKAPVWIDNRESVILLPETDLQLINLVVSEHHPQLTQARNWTREAATA